VRIGDICTRRVLVASQDERILGIAERMRDDGVGALVVVTVRHGGHVPVGMLTDRDIVIGALAWQPALIGYLTVADAMSGDVVTVHEDERVDTALSRMRERGIRRLPVVDSTGTLVGILTLDDVLAYTDGRHSALVARVVRAQRRERLSPV
jgi:CBS domain-containing protein